MYIIILPKLPNVPERVFVSMRYSAYRIIPVWTVVDPAAYSTIGLIPDDSAQEMLAEIRSMGHPQAQLRRIEWPTG